MRFIIMHKTNPHWEAGAIPTPEFIARVGAPARADCEGWSTARRRGSSPELGGSAAQLLRRASESVTKGPFEGGNELPAAFSIVAPGRSTRPIEWASRQAKMLGDVEIEVRPVTEPWDIGMMPSRRRSRRSATWCCERPRPRRKPAAAVVGTAGRAGAARSKRPRQRTCTS